MLLRNLVYAKKTREFMIKSDEFVNAKSNCMVENRFIADICPIKTNKVIKLVKFSNVGYFPVGISCLSIKKAVCKCLCFSQHLNILTYF